MSKHAIIVDDSVANRNVLSLLLRSFGFTTIVAENGSSAIWVLKQQMKFDLIIVDYHMPGISGAALTKWIRNQADLKEVPVLMITSDTSKASEALESGVTELLGKPFNREDLECVLNRMMDMSVKPGVPKELSEEEQLRAELLAMGISPDEIF